nr:hypothetical protein [Tanacetum cinerariifolium]
GFTAVLAVLITEASQSKQHEVEAECHLFNVRIKRLHDDLKVTVAQYKDAKSLFAAIQTKFGDNEATKKTHKTLLKRMYKNFSAPSIESLDSIFNKLQKIVSQLSILVWRNKPTLDTMSFDDLYNNFKIVKQEVKVTANLSSSLNSHNMAFVSSPSSTNEVNTAYEVSTANTQANPSSTQVSTANLNDATVIKTALEGMCMWKKPLPKLQLLSMELVFNWSYMAEDVVPTNMALMAFSDSEKSELEKLKQEKESNQLKIENFDNIFKSLDKLIGSQIPDNSKKGLGYKSYHVVPPPPTGLFSPPKLDLSNSGLEEFQQPEFEGYGPKTSKSVSEDIPNELKKYLDAFLVKDRVLDNKDCSVESSIVVEKKTVVPTIAKVEVVRPKQQQKPVRKTVRNLMEDMLPLVEEQMVAELLQFWATAKVKTVNGEEQIHALVDKKKVIITETSVRSDLQLQDAEGMVKNKEIYVPPSHTKKIFANMKRQGKEFSGKVTPLFETMMVQPQEDMGEDSEIPIDSHHTPTVN